MTYYKYELFDRILCRQGKGAPWLPNFFSHPLPGDQCVTITGETFNDYIPYEGHEDLALTTREPEGQYP